MSSFPVVVALGEADASLRSGRAVEVRLDLPVAGGLTGVAIALSALALQWPAEMDDPPPHRADVFVWTPAGEAGPDGTGTAEPRTVSIGAVDEDRVVVTEGLAAGERVVTAGVGFLHPGQVVRLTDDAVRIAGGGSDA